MGVTHDLVRLWVELCNDEGMTMPIIDFADLFRTDSDFYTLKDALEKGHLTIDEFLGENYFEEEGSYFSDDNFVITHDSGVYHRDDVVYCEGFDSYFPDTERMHDIYHGWRGNLMSVSQTWIDENRRDLYLYNGEYYDGEALEYCELVVMYDGQVMSRDEVYYWEVDGAYHYDSEPEDNYTRPYHENNVTQSPVSFTKAPQYFVGIEAEKEDWDVKSDIDIDLFEDYNPGWRKEADSTLDEMSGFELISPPMELIPDKIMHYIRHDMKDIESHIEADFSSRCGGHMHVSETGMSGKSLFEKIKGYTPLLNALYYKRIDKHYSKAKANSTMLSYPERYQSVNILNNRIEIRIFSAIRDMTNLHWRLRLVEKILNHPAACPSVAFFNIHAHFKPLLMEVYDTPERFEVLNDRIIEYTSSFESITLKKEDVAATQPSETLVENG